MNTAKDIILENITMEEILDKYNIRKSRDMFCCPFHNDKSPSAKMYSNSYFCFACGKWGDTIQFVQDYFNLSFIDAIKKIDYDFNLNLNLNCGNLSKEQIEQIEKRKILKQDQKEKHFNKMLNLCKTINMFEKIYRIIKAQLNPYNWEEIEEKCASLKTKIELLDEEFDELNIKKY